MYITDVIFSGLKEELLYDLININEEFKSKGKSDSNNPMTLGQKKSFILDQIRITFKFEKANLLDVDVLKMLGSNLYLNNKVDLDEYPFASLYNIDTMKALKDTQPDIYEYVMEVSSILKSLSEEDHNEWKDFAPIGCYKFSGYITYSGNNISSIFGGLVEDLIYKLYKDKKDLDDKEIEEKLKSTLYNNFMNKFLSTYYNNTTKRGLIEDYLMKTKYFDYVDRYNDNKERYSYIVAKIRNLIGNSISFLGNISEFELVNSIKIFNNDISFTDQVYNSDSSKNLTTMLSEINTSIANKADATDLTELETKINNLVTGAPETNDTLLEISQYIEEHQDEYDDLPSENEYYFVVSSDLITYLLLKNFMTNINVVAFESMDQIYSDKEMKIQSNLRVITTHGTRLNIMISKNKTIREIITKDTDSQLGLSMPYNRYGLMLSYQRIKYLVKLTNANPEDLLSDHFVSQKDSIFTRYRNLVSDLVSMRDSITRSYLKMES